VGKFDNFRLEIASILSGQKEGINREELDTREEVSRPITKLSLAIYEAR
jgi:hypothetical protein